MYLTGQQPTDTLRSVARGAARGVGAILFVLIGAPMLGLGVPLFWVWIASQLAGTERQITVAVAVFITTGILVSYWGLLIAGALLRVRLVGRGEAQAKVRRMSWNRSFRDEPLRSGDRKSDPVERLFMITAIAGFIAFEIWFAFFAGSPLPG